MYNNALFLQPPPSNLRKFVPNVQPTDPREELKRKAIVLNLPEPIYHICPTTIKNTKEPSVFAQVKVCKYVSIIFFGIIMETIMKYEEMSS